ncbi:hypothetical protein Slin15195_G049650 [Septoria linicola]|uniref:Uncharacterized protein n=1 Tax=Septoria linicola TaxID=215465 RepID=A0A9Q9EHB3_9PEZI|nr:hypothetical protein Slin15195_G049650 [Septoria linicola]
MATRRIKREPPALRYCEPLRDFGLNGRGCEPPSFYDFPCCPENGHGLDDERNRPYTSVPRMFDGEDDLSPPRLSKNGETIQAIPPRDVNDILYQMVKISERLKRHKHKTRDWTNIKIRLRDARLEKLRSLQVVKAQVQLFQFRMIAEVSMRDDSGLLQGMAHFLIHRMGNLEQGKLRAIAALRLADSHRETRQPDAGRLQVANFRLLDQRLFRAEIEAKKQGFHTEAIVQWLIQKTRALRKALVTEKPKLLARKLAAIEEARRLSIACLLKEDDLNASSVETRPQADQGNFTVARAGSETGGEMPGWLSRFWPGTEAVGSATVGNDGTDINTNVAERDATSTSTDTPDSEQDVERGTALTYAVPVCEHENSADHVEVQGIKAGETSGQHTGQAVAVTSQLDKVPVSVSDTPPGTLAGQEQELAQAGRGAILARLEAMFSASSPVLAPNLMPCDGSAATATSPAAKDTVDVEAGATKVTAGQQELEHVRTGTTAEQSFQQLEMEGVRAGETCEQLLERACDLVTRLLNEANEIAVHWDEAQQDIELAHIEQAFDRCLARIQADM